eukprot:CAMPEP_0183437704 /NCGR_PEP_ID=MMETSP0370-20130417/74246_1 /TAXON_ID=268820 /ORGANISM="Peridinium aciculiferum, Strain PAER-2" /LENGTH=110 /DNA_ID=CAMNT_0025625613 /DNA_START=169 /DNA_END=501 /DNA_ORIENTATION=-
MEQRLGRFEDFHVSRLSLLDGLVVFVPGLRLSDEALVQPLQAVRQDGELFLDLGLVLLFGQDLSIQLVALLPEVLDGLHELVVVVLQGGTLGRHCGDALATMQTRWRASG